MSKSYNATAGRDVRRETYFRILLVEIWIHSFLESNLATFILKMYIISTFWLKSPILGIYSIDLKEYIYNTNNTVYCSTFVLQKLETNRKLEINSSIGNTEHIIVYPQIEYNVTIKNNKLDPIIQQQKNQSYFKNGQKTWIRHFSKDIQTSKKHIIRYSTSLISRKMQIKSIMRYYFPPIWVAIIKRKTQ